MRDMAYNGIYNDQALEDNIFNILDPIITRLGIEYRRQNGVLDNLKAEYQKRRVPEFANGIANTQAAIKLINVQVKNIEDLSSSIANISNATNENFNQLANEINRTFTNVCSYYGLAKLRLTDQEKESLRISISNYVANQKRKLYNNRGSSEQKNASENRSSFNSINNSIQKKNTLKNAFARFNKKKKQNNTDEIMIDYNSSRRGR